MTETPKSLLSPFGGSWIPDDSPPEGQRAALHRLAAALREATELLLVTEAPEDELLAAAGRAEQFAQRLALAPRKRPLWGFAESSNAGNHRAMFDSSPLIGMGNPIAPPLHLSIVDDHVEGTATFGTQYEGPPGHVHGGIIAAAFDEVLGMTQSLSGIGGMTGTLTVRYRKPTPLHREVLFTGRPVRVERKKIFVAGTLHLGDVLCAEAEGIFISVDFERMRQLAADR
ncbi:MAG: PaaI family thioesterase [Tepidiformaceae bacterium]